MIIGGLGLGLKRAELSSHPEKAPHALFFCGVFFRTLFRPSGFGGPGQKEQQNPYVGKEQPRRPYRFFIRTLGNSREDANRQEPPASPRRGPLHNASHQSLSDCWLGLELVWATVVSKNQSETVYPTRDLSERAVPSPVQALAIKNMLHAIHQTTPRLLRSSRRCNWPPRSSMNGCAAGTTEWADSPSKPYSGLEGESADAVLGTYIV